MCQTFERRKGQDMTTEEILESFIEEGARSYKKLSRNSPEGRKLTRKEPVEIDGVEFSCWREYAVYKAAEHISSILPGVPISVDLDGNDTVIKIEVDSKEEQKLNGALYSLLKKVKRI